MKQRTIYKPYIEIVSGSMWSQRQQWRAVASAFSSNVCLLVPDPTNQKQAELMGMLARSFRAAGRQVFIWKPSNQSKKIK